jgi:hypothetical protein
MVRPRNEMTQHKQVAERNVKEIEVAFWAQRKEGYLHLLCRATLGPDEDMEAEIFMHLETGRGTRDGLNRVHAQHGDG